MSNVLSDDLFILKFDNDRKRLEKQFIIGEKLYELSKKIITSRPIKIQEVCSELAEEKDKTYVLLLEKVEGFILDDLNNKERYLWKILESINLYQNVLSKEIFNFVSPLDYISQFYNNFAKRLFPNDSLDILNCSKEILSLLDSCPKVISHNDLNGGNIVIKTYKNPNLVDIFFIDLEKVCLKHPLGDPINLIYHERIKITNPFDFINNYAIKYGHKEIENNLFFEVARMCGVCKKYNNISGMRYHLKNLLDISKSLESSFKDIKHLTNSIEILI